MVTPAPLLYQLAADVVVVVHLLFILFVIAGGFLVLSNRKWVFVHLPAALWAATIEFTGWYCPLTPLENWLRLQGGESGYATGFVEHYLLPLLYPAALTRDLQISLGLGVICVNALVYFLVWRRRRTAPAAGNSGPDTP